jgi:hypothetical protein
LRSLTRLRFPSESIADNDIIDAAFVSFTDRSAAMSSADLAKLLEVICPVRPSGI